MSSFLYKFIYREIENSIRVWNLNELKSTISCDGIKPTNEEILRHCQKWLDDKNLSNVEFKVYVEL